MTNPGMLKERPRTAAEAERAGLRTSAPRSLRQQPAKPRRNLHRAPAYRGRLGSQQRVSERGRRLQPIKQENSRVFRFVSFVVAACIIGTVAVMLLAGMTTEKTFQVTDAEAKSKTLANEITTLERDVEKAKSAQNLSAKAAELGMVAPGQAGILETNGDKVEQRRESDNSKDRRIVDVTGNKRTREATSSPEETRNIPGLAPSSPAGAAAAGNMNSGDLPYANQGHGAPAPAPAPAPALANGEHPAPPAPPAAQPAPAAPAEANPGPPAAPRP